MSKYHFGVSRKRLTRRQSSTIDRIAKAHDAYLVEANLPDGYKRWFCCRNLGHPFDDARAKAVLDAIDTKLGLEVL